jgi:hypothetical protein
MIHKNFKKIDFFFLMFISVLMIFLVDFVRLLTIFLVGFIFSSLNFFAKSSFIVLFL